MDERAVRRAAERIVREGHGIYMGLGQPCRLVPVAAIDELVYAVADAPDEPPEDVPTDRSPAD